uniref:Uncharacterized protein n=1 Tax=Panagrolaimus sp. JU765 TaxID=591449 RepID=A0AC34R277_9BILA
MLIVFFVLLTFFGNCNSKQVELSVSAPAFQNNDFKAYYELVKEPIQVEFNFGGAPSCTDKAQLLCFCYLSTIPETAENEYCGKKEHTGFCINANGTSSILHMYTGYGDGNSTGYLINYSTGKKIEIPPMKVKMAIAKDKNVVPVVSFYARGVAHEGNNNNPINCGNVVVTNVYSEQLEEQHLLKANDPIGDTKARCVNECYCKKSI